MIVTCLSAASSTQEVVRRAGAFAVNILAEDQQHLAMLFSRSDPDPFRDLAEVMEGSGMPRRRIGIFGAVGPNLLPTHADARPGP